MHSQITLPELPAWLLLRIVSLKWTWHIVDSGKRCRYDDESSADSLGWICLKPKDPPHVQRLLHPAACKLILLRVAERPAGLVGMPPRPASLAWPVPMYESERDIAWTEHPIYASQVWQSARSMLEGELVHVVHDLQEAGYTVSVAVRFSEPVAEIVNFVETEDVNLVATASHGRTGLRRLVLGSVAAGVLQRLQVPVLLLRPFDRLTSDETTK